MYNVSSSNLESLQDQALQIVEQLPYLQILILFGSRATDEATDTRDFILPFRKFQDIGGEKFMTLI